VITALWALATADLLMGEPAATPSARRRARAVEQRR